MGYAFQPDYCRKVAPIQERYSGLAIGYAPGAVSKQFIETVKSTLSTIPALLLEIMGRRGYVLILSTSLVEVHPELKRQKPRGHSQSSEYGNLNGLCCPSEGHIHITEYGDGSRDTEDTLMHELGHAIDSCIAPVVGLGNRDISLLFEFNRLYLQDVAQLSLSAQKALRYYIQNSSSAGRSEAFAEGIASLMGGGCQDASYFRENFPRVVSWIEETIFKQLGIPVVGSDKANSCISSIIEHIEPSRKSLIEKRKALLESLIAVRSY